MRMGIHLTHDGTDEKQAGPAPISLWGAFHDGDVERGLSGLMVPLAHIAYMAIECYVQQQLL